MRIYSMDNNLKKLLLGAAIIGGLGGAYYLTMVKSTDRPEILEKKEDVALPEQTKQETVTDAKEAPVVETKEQPTAEETKLDAAVPAEEYTDASVAAVITDLNKNITIADVKKTADLLPRQMREVPFQTMYPILLRQAVDMVILEHNAIKEGFDKKTEIKTAITERKRAILIASFLEKEVDEKVSDDVLMKKYEEVKKMIPKDEEEFEIAHILVKTEAEAKKLIKDIESGKITFEKALEKSLDEKTKTTDGKIGFLKRMEVQPELFEKISKTDDGSVVSEPLNFGKMGSSVLRVLSSRPLTVPKFEEIKAELKKAMMPELSQEIIKKIKTDANVKLFALDGSAIPERSEEELKKALETDLPSAIDASKMDEKFVCATFKGEQVSLADLRSAYDVLPEMLRILPFEKMYELVLIKVVNERILFAAAEKAGLEKDDKVQEKIAVESRMVMQDAYLKARAETLITETDLKSDYERIKKNLADKNEMEYRLRHIMTATEEEAKAILAKLKSGKSFDDLMESSIDDATKANKGELGYVRKRYLPKDYQEVITKAVKGTLVNKVIKLADGKFSVMRLEDKRSVTPPSFEQMKDQIKSALIAKKAVEVLEQNRSKMAVSYKNLKGLPTASELEVVFKKINAQMSEVLKNGGLPMPGAQ
jgi:peptidyl-prolyl cis-trans isomerase C